MFHTDRDIIQFLFGLLTIVGTFAAAICAVAVAVKIWRQQFESLQSVCISFVFTSLVSVPFVSSLILVVQAGEWPVSQMILLPDPLDDWPILGWLPSGIIILPELLLLTFAWIAPPRQYLILKRSPPTQTR
ncbi:MAG: hypothetical protein KDA52_03285 [Planctomycetaceae bacterium]|nr:hypothetical protein [Planctomycetaceae bacterium]